MGLISRVSSRTYSSKMRDIINPNYKYDNPTLADMDRSIHSLTIQETQRVGALTDNSDLGNKNKSLLLQPFYQSKDESYQWQALIFGRWKRHYDQMVEEVTKNNFSTWCAQYRVRLDQILGIDFWKFSEPRPDLGSTCRSCDLVTATLMFALQRRISYCQTNYLPKYRRFYWKWLRFGLMPTAAYLLFFQPCQEDIKIMFNYKSWVNPKLIDHSEGGSFGGQTLNRLEAEVHEIDMLKKMAIIKEMRGDPGTFITIDENDQTRDWQAEKAHGEAYRKHKKDKLLEEDRSAELEQKETIIYMKRLKEFLWEKDENEKKA